MAAGPHQGDDTHAPRVGDRLTALGLQLDRERERARRQWRRWQSLKELDDTEAAVAGQQWSDTIEAALRSAEQISQEPGSDIHDLVSKFEAAWWWLIEDDSILDATAKRWLLRFRRELRRLARNI